MDDRLKVLVALQMRYKVPKPEATVMAEAWLQANPDQTWASLNSMLKSSQVVVAGDQLVFAGSAPQSPPSQATAQSPPPSAPSNKAQRMYRGRPI
ncbi:hypothetical protein [Acaryochloris marina]|uniref:Uncharacterized protein n=1 Tax=Acaryochloris marina (strain MBIC 11017) TaxID=329726 RepID=B0BZN2_ACAM1|nr:hypothetical protein [Acaryochloris marina]ABW25958.1 hypothetical protein AM1_0916 [Acaryochloris marina MBIC11017]BDM80810.1 hypothetical protein AM10699_36780 [Acaryochloris marina MBIC10699]